MTITQENMLSKCEQITRTKIITAKVAVILPGTSLQTTGNTDTGALLTRICKK